ncbi:hypothetical protein GALL_441510 [mine drainage metagenome]|uniref:Uncharacterized protein n=1 Tax=mine drainage metagenome TaxID=410659 RepID=A0A1J5Q9N6_9ZZZZ
MAHLCLVGQVEQRAIGLGPGEGGDRQWCHEFLGRMGQYRPHLCAAFAQAADQIQRFVGRDTAADDQKDALACQHIGPLALLAEVLGRRAGRHNG